MAVMLRSLGVPARLAVGYTSGDEVDSELYAVTDSHSHAWVEVYMPGFSWIPFEPTPGKRLPAVYLEGVGSLDQPSQQEFSGVTLSPIAWMRSSKGVTNLRPQRWTRRP